MRVINFSVITILFIISILFTSCQKTADVGTFQDGTQTYSLTGFTKLQMGSAFKIEVQRGSSFSVVARGDQRNLNDLRVRVENGTLIADYFPNNNVSRQYRTEFTIIMPALEGVAFSGASESNIGGFESNAITIDLSGASKSNFSSKIKQTGIRLSGASILRMVGEGQKMTAEVSGASNLESFSFPVEEAQIKVSGASNAKVSVSKLLDAEAGGASEIRYTGNPQIINNNLTGSSRLIRE